MRATDEVALSPDCIRTGIEWLGDIPSDWKVKRLKWSVEGCFNGVWGDEPDGVDDVVCLRVADFNRDNFTVSTDQLTIRAVEQKQLESRRLKPGDLLLEKSGGGEKQLVGCVVYFDHSFDSVCSNFVARMPVAKDQHSRYWAYVHASLYAGRLNYPAIKQSTGIQNLDAAVYLNTLVAFPPKEQQQKIATFLDWKTNQIDALIAKKQELLQKLKEKRLAVITQAVTKGLNPDAPMRDSGVAWLGEVPAHWEVKRLRFATKRIEQGWSPQCESQPADEDAWGVMKVGCVNGDEFDPTENKALPTDLEAKPEYELRARDILISRANTRELLGSAAIVPAGIRSRLLLCDKLFRLCPDENVDEEFLTCYLRTPAARYQYEREATGSSGSMQNIGQGTLKNLVVVVPSLHEQKAIFRYVRVEAAKLDALVESAQSAITRLTEYRTALITAATTGKIDVRNWKPREIAA
jgi:type I restriction enzyme S subunit